jgi:hypothetical protein
MPLTPRPTWAPLPDPEGVDPALAQEFQVMAAEDLSGVDAATDQAGLDLAGVGSALTDAEDAADQLGLDIVAGAVELGDMAAEADQDTLLTEIAAALDQDAVLDQAAGDVAGALPS